MEGSRWFSCSFRADKQEIAVFRRDSNWKSITVKSAWYFSSTMRFFCHWSTHCWAASPWQGTSRIILHAHSSQPSTTHSGSYHSHVKHTKYSCTCDLSDICYEANHIEIGSLKAYIFFQDKDNNSKLKMYLKWKAWGTRRLFFSRNKAWEFQDTLATSVYKKCMLYYESWGFLQEESKPLS